MGGNSLGKLKNPDFIPGFSAPYRQATLKQICLFLCLFVSIPLRQAKYLKAAGFSGHDFFKS